MTMTIETKQSHFWRLFWATAVMLITIAAVGRALNLAYNTSLSAPVGIYRYQPLVFGERPPLGSLVVACLPATLAALGRDRGYIHAGGCPDGNEPVLKTLLARGGEVRVSDAELLVDGKSIAGFRRVALDRSGRLIPTIPAGVYELKPDQVWLHSSRHPMSWDSRYYGPIPSNSVRAIARPLLVLP